MGPAAQPRREHRTVAVDRRDDGPCVRLPADGKARAACGLALPRAPGFRRTPPATGDGRGCLTRHAPSGRVRLGGVATWRLRCPGRRAAFTVPPRFILRHRQRPPEVAREAPFAPHGGRSLARCAAVRQVSPVSPSRLICARGRRRVVTVRTRRGPPLPTSFLAEEQPRHGRTETAEAPAIVRGRVVRPRGDTEAARAAALTPPSQAAHRAASRPAPSGRGRGLPTDGVDSTTQSLRPLVPGARPGGCPRRAPIKPPQTPAATAPPVRRA
jgi:hypothetical protein